MAGAVTGLHTFGPDVGPENLTLLDGNYSLLLAALNALGIFSNYYVDSGAVNAMVVTVASPQTVALSDGLMLQIKVAAANTSATPTLNVNGLGAKPVVNSDNSALGIGQISTGQFIHVIFDATENVFRLINVSGRIWLSGNLAPLINGRGLSIDGDLFQLGRSGGVNNPFLGLTATDGSGGSVTLYASGTSIPIFNLAVAGKTCISLSSTGLVTLPAPTSGNSLAIGGVVTSIGPIAAAPVDMTPDSATFNLVLTGCTTSPNVPVSARRVGNLAMLKIGGQTGTSNATTMTLTGLPAAWQPAAPQVVICEVADNGFSILGQVNIGTSGTITCAAGVVSGTQLRLSYNGFTNSGVKGFLEVTTICYELA